MRNLELGSYRTAWFMAHRIRWALGQEPLATQMKGVVEIDETYVGGKRNSTDSAIRRLVSQATWASIRAKIKLRLFR